MQTADIVAAEDTRRLRWLADALQLTVRGRVVSYYDANEATRTEELVAALRGGARVPQPLFPLGQVVATPGALDLLAWYQLPFAQLIERHHHGDWGNLPPEDVEENELALRHGGRLLSSYPICDCDEQPCGEHVIWIITETDRSATTLLHPEDY